MQFPCGCNSHSVCYFLYDHDDSNDHHGSYEHNEYDGFNIHEFYYIAFISNKYCYGYVHNGSNLQNSYNGHINCYGHKGLIGL